MDAEKRVLVGVDLADDYTQICYSVNGGSLNSVSLSNDPAKYKFPTLMCARAGQPEWLFGEDAAAAVPDENTVIIDRLVTLAEVDEGIEIFGRLYPADILIERFFRKLTTILKDRIGVSRISGMVITVKRCKNMLAKNIMSAAELLGMDPANVKVITHLESFMYYVISQNQDIWINDVGLFDFDPEDVVFYKLTFGRKTRPVSVVADKTVLTDEINYSMLTTGNMEETLAAFENVASKVLHKQIISALYFTGAGFESSWADEVLKRLCTGRRIFRGQNLYVKGAGFAAGMLLGADADKFKEEYSFFGEDVLRSSLCIRVYKDGAYEELPIASAGDRFKDTNARIEVLMDRTNELDLIVHNVLKKDFICAIMTLETLRLRDDRTTRLDVRVRFPERDVCVITVRDMGFGEIYETDHKIWEQVLKI